MVGYTLYVHNLGRFYGIILIKELAKLNYKIYALWNWNYNALLKIKISDLEIKQSITIMDRINLLPQSLDKLLEKFNCSLSKGVFPHLFLNSNNLIYVGKIPAFNTII